MKKYNGTRNESKSCDIFVHLLEMSYKFDPKISHRHKGNQISPTIQ